MRGRKYNEKDGKKNRKKDSKERNVRVKEKDRGVWELKQQGNEKER